jgi:hypothetical protein
MPGGQHFHTMFRSSHVIYKTRPPSSCRTARKAWDKHAKKGRIIWMRLLDGYWGAELEDGKLCEIENCAVNRD